MRMTRYCSRILTGAGTTALLTKALCLLLLALPVTAAPDGRQDSWRDVVRQTPYWASQGMAKNLSTVRRWVLLSDSYCRQPQRHLLFDHRGAFLAYIKNGKTPQETNTRLNETRQRLVDSQRVQHWSPGAEDRHGYPFALACHQPFADMQEAIARLTGEEADDRVWGTWDDISVGSKAQPVSLVALFRVVYEKRKAQGRFTFPDSVMPSFLGKTIIESGGRKGALSRQSARGIMQLRPAVLDDCEIPQAFRLHRIAQVDCALRLVEQNHRNLQAPFKDVFGDLPAQKRESLYSLLLIQAYQIGVGRVTQLLQDEQLGKAARYFAAHPERFSAEDIQLGMIYHNMGRRDLGLKTLYYVTDVGLAREALCDSEAMDGDPWCEQRRP